MTAKIVSLLLAAAGLLLMWSAEQPEEPLDTSMAFVLARATPILVVVGLVAVWLSNWLGSFVGPMARGGYVDSATPPLAFVCFGYLLLALPLIAGLMQLW